MDAAHSCELDKLATLQIGKGLAYIGGQHFKIGIVLPGQPEHDLA